MVRRSKTPIKKKVEVKVDPKDRLCSKCEFAYLMRSQPFNPIVCECSKTKERHVASTPHTEDCGFKESKSEMVIHEMIYLK